MILRFFVLFGLIIVTVINISKLNIGSYQLINVRKHQSGVSFESLRIFELFAKYYPTPSTTFASCVLKDLELVCSKIYYCVKKWLTLMEIAVERK